jgi:predicted DNA-binding transcriptional regulator YafY
MARTRGVGKGKPRKRPATPRPMTKPAMRDWALRLLRLLNERRVLTSRIVAEEFGVALRTAQRYLLVLSDLPCVITDEKKHSYTMTADYIVSDGILNVSEMSMVCALIDYATHIFGAEHSRFLTGLKNRIFRMPGVYQIVGDDAIDMDKVTSNLLALERHIKGREIVSFSYRKSGKRYTTEPYKILYYGGFWYLVAKHDGKTKKFLLDFIENVRPTGNRYPEVPESVRRVLEKAQTIWFDDRETEKVAVEFDASVAHFFRRKNFFPHQEIVQTRENGDIVVSFDVHNEMHFHEQTARWMPYFRVLSPDAYRKRVCAIGLEAASRNESDAG